ncbi:hypothetical protein ABT127_18625 [Streptomyces sp. NPDC001904]|uniref:hypothetical protein n=1 Tax=Streptomyces sp. NPDC001904 TaxID=3154531 RepID=UPI003320E8D4
MHVPALPQQDDARQEGDPGRQRSGASGLAVGLLVTPSATADKTGAAEALKQSRAAAADAAAAKAAAPRTRASRAADSTVVSGVTLDGGNSARVGTTNVDTDNALTWYLKRWSRLSNDAAPEPIAKGKKITITRKLERANWDTQQTVRLQERSLTGSYATTSSHITGTGSLAGVEKQTRTATADRCYRYKFEGTSTTPPVTATGDCVDVR